MRRILLYFTLILIPIVVAGCGDDAVKPAANSGSTTEVRGEISESDGAFEVEFQDLSVDGRPSPGPFLLRGRNVHYDDSVGALVADLTVMSLARTAFPEPVRLTFVKLLPPGVTVLNPDNEIHGPGAQIEFQFENDDGMWTPGETSLPRTVQFGIEKGHAIGFVARLGTAPHPMSDGQIGGVVWADLDEDGERDRGEPGIAGVRIVLKEQSSDPRIMAPVVAWDTWTRADGSYRFGGLRAGHYLVMKLERPDLKPTTPTEINVLLVEDDSSGVSDFMHADFGCVLVDVPPPPPPDSLLHVGDWIEARGKYDGDTDVLVARDYDHVPCQVWIPCDSTGGYGCPCTRAGGVLRGPVTGNDPEGGHIEVMGVRFAFPPGIVIPVGARIEIHVEPFFVGYGVVHFEMWEGDHDEIHGKIWRIFDGNSTDAQRAINVLGLRVALAHATNG